MWAVVAPSASVRALLSAFVPIADVLLATVTVDAIASAALAASESSLPVSGPYIMLLYTTIEES